MNDFLKNLRKKAYDYKKTNNQDFNKAKQTSYYYYEELMKKGEGINQKIRMEKIYMQSKYGDSIKNQSYNSIHSKWLSFRDKYLSANAASTLHKLKVMGAATQKIVEDADIKSKLYQAQQKLNEKGLDTNKINSISQKGMQFATNTFKKARLAFNEQNLRKYFYRPLDYITQMAMKNKSKAFKGILLLTFCYGLGSYIPIAIKDYYLQKSLLTTYQQLQEQQAQLQQKQSLLQSIKSQQSQNNQQQ